ncbi:hypothetical protein FFK22_016945 [Mycobacterium sp. KBS0706]|uniref:DUF7831 domain-containing protein n=1 Tax=Mycobacterium sp. KBS0706 TaxID=2578109 RepID=UPI00110F7481|nr:hypothetical protein [Mycobacterium sp. KBS0706]TSD87531.1 hypothetical protein FFK22_016945 [Mycobacterium sp. KBS0706]
MGIRYAVSYLREQIKAAPDTLYIFGDNFERKGFGGQAAEARGEPNAVGIPTKRAPSMRPDAFMTDADLERLQAEARLALDRLRRHLDAGGDVVMPEAGIGTGLAQMATRAPACWAWLCAELRSLGIENPAS